MQLKICSVPKAEETLQRMDIAAEAYQENACYWDMLSPLEIERHLSIEYEYFH